MRNMGGKGKWEKEIRAKRGMGRREG